MVFCSSKGKSSIHFSNIVLSEIGMLFTYTLPSDVKVDGLMLSMSGHSIKHLMRFDEYYYLTFFKESRIKLILYPFSGPSNITGFIESPNLGTNFSFVLITFLIIISKEGKHSFI